ncbi:PH domain-containing protein [Streptomyces cinnamoneus]|uniref:PH domain-containing protein n=1 Tax=Streptomyces cinnamoneus TaxID=53446 RepID=UPI00379BEFF1
MNRPAGTHRPDAPATGEQPAGPAAPRESGPPWRRLDNRLLLVQLKWLIPPALSTAFYAMITLGRLDSAAFIRLGLLTGVFLMLMLWRLVQLLTTRYRVAGDLLEVHTGLVGRRHRSIPCDRIRGVDITADPFHRVFGLVVVKITTAQRGGDNGDTQLEALRKDEAHELRRVLLRRAATSATTTADDDGTIARMDWAWVRYMPLTCWGVLGIAILFGMALRLLDGFGVKPEKVLHTLVHLLGTDLLWQTIVVGTVAVLAIGTLAAVAMSAEEWWGYRFERDDDGNLAVNRGLLTTRSLSIDACRMRGIEIAEPLLLRLGGGAQVAAVATGLDKADDSEVTKLKTLTPGIPRALADDIAATVAGEQPSPTTVPLTAHPRAALRRRHTRAALTVLGTCAVPAVLGLFLTPVLLHIAWISALVLLPLGAWLATDAYRALGHTVRGRHLITRYGTFKRRTVALQRDSVIGWKIVRSPTQRWAGLATVMATTAAGKEGAYPVYDVQLGEGLAFADEAVPHLLAPFLDRG